MAHKRKRPISIELDLWDYIQRLTPRLTVLEARADRLADASDAYEEATQDPTPEEEAQLDRIMTVMSRAMRQRDDMAERIELCRKAYGLLEDEASIRIDTEHRLIRERNRRKRLRDQQQGVSQ